MKAEEAEHTTVVIIGGGAAGLAAATVLHREGVPFVLLEAASVLGGRIREVPFHGYTIETGAQWIHGVTTLHKEYGIRLFRCQDTNFLTITRNTLTELADLMDASDLDIMLYIETRPEGVGEKTIEMLQKLKVDGVGMGVELSTQDFREDKLRRFASQERIIKAFKLLKDAGIKRTSYNIIGLPDADEESIWHTIEFNRLLDPDNVTVAFYSPYQGTAQQKKGNELGYFDEYEFHVDGQLRTMSRDSLVDPDLLVFYKAKFRELVEQGLDNLDQMKAEYFAEQAASESGVGASTPKQVTA